MIVGAVMVAGLFLGAAVGLLVGGYNRNATITEAEQREEFIDRQRTYIANLTRQNERLISAAMERLEGMEW